MPTAGELPQALRLLVWRWKWLTGSWGLALLVRVVRVAFETIVPQLLASDAGAPLKTALTYLNIAAALAGLVFWILTVLTLARCIRLLKASGISASWLWVLPCVILGALGTVVAAGLFYLDKKHVGSLSKAIHEERDQAGNRPEAR